MDYANLKSELTDDPLGRGYAAMTAEEVVESLNAANRTEIYSRRIDERDVLREWPTGAVAADVFLRKVEAVAAAQPGAYIALVIGWLKPSEGGVDIGCPRTRADLDVLAGVAGITTDEVAALKAMAERTRSRAEELGLPTVMRGDILRYKPES